MRVAALDPANTGAAESVLYIRDGHKYLAMERWAQLEAPDLVGNIERLHRRYHPDIYIVDCDGLGAPIRDLMVKQGLPCHSYHGNGRCDRRDATGELGFLNMRSWTWWNFRELLDPRNEMQITLPRDDKLIGELAAVKWSVRLGSIIEVESKQQIIRRIGKSPDTADAVVMCYWPAEMSVYEEAYRVHSPSQIEKLIQRPDDRPERPENEQLDEMLFRGAQNNFDVFGF